MNNIYNLTDVNNILKRLENLTTCSEKKWGKMEVSQMLAHCSLVMKVAMGQLKPQRSFLGLLIGSFFKSRYYNDMPFSKSSPTGKGAIIADNRDFEKEKAILKTLIIQFYEGGKDKCTKHPHPFFGHFTPDQWSIGMYKHLDHHFKQFGV